MVLKKVGFLGIAAGLVSPVFAEEKSKAVNISAVVRTDVVQQKRKVDSEKEQSLREGFVLKNVDLKLEGMLPGTPVGYEIVLKPLRMGEIPAESAAGAPGGGSVDGATDVLATAVAKHKVHDMVELAFGRMLLNVGSVEQNYASADMYFGSYILGHSFFDATATGAQVSLMPLANEDHVIRLQVLNGVTKAATGGADTNGGRFSTIKGGMSTSLAYYGNLMGGMLKPVVSYAQIRTAEAKYTDKATGVEYKYDATPASVLGIGTTINVADLWVDLEYDVININKIKTRIGAAEGEVKAQTVNSIIAQVKYNIAAANVTPFVKFTNEQGKWGANEGRGDLDSSLIAFGAEYQANKAIRYHAGWGQTQMSEKKMKADGGNRKTTKTDVTVGATVKI